MFASRSIAAHLMRGVIAAALDCVGGSSISPRIRRSR